MDEPCRAGRCPASQSVRQRQTELGRDVVLRRMRAERLARDALRARTGADIVPVLAHLDLALVGNDAVGPLAAEVRDLLAGVVARATAP